MKEIDASKGAGQLLRLALTCSLLTNEPLVLTNVCSSYTPPGITQTKVALLQRIESLGLATIRGVGVGSTTIQIQPHSLERVRHKIDLDLHSSASVILALDGMILPLLFSEQKITLTIKGTTHGNRSPPATFYKETYFRYLKPYLASGNLDVTQLGCYPERGEITVAMLGKGKLCAQTPPLKITAKPELVAIKANLIHNKESYLQTIEKFLRLIFSSKEAPFTLQTRIAKNNVTALTLLGFYGDKEGFDMDKPFVKGIDILKEGDVREKTFLQLAKQFQQELLEPYLDEHTADLLTPLLGIVGGSIPISYITPHMEAAIPLLEKLLGVQFTFEDHILSCDGYTRHLKEKIISIDDL